MSGVSLCSHFHCTEPCVGSRQESNLSSRSIQSFLWNVFNQSLKIVHHNSSLTWKDATLKGYHMHQVIELHSPYKVT